MPAAVPSPAYIDVLDSLFGASADAVVLVTSDGQRLYENSAAAARQVPLREHVDLSSAFVERRSTTFECGDVGPAGVRSWYVCTVAPAREADAVVGALVTAKDVTALKQSEERLRRSEKLLVDTQGVAHLGTWEWDVSEPNARWSDELYRIYGLTPETYTPSYAAYLTKVHPDDRQRVADATNRVFHEHVPYSHDERIFLPDGSIRYLHTWAYPVLDDSGKLTKLVGVCQDITDRKLAEEEVLRLNESLERRVADRTRMIERSLRDLEAFQAMVSHDLRAPLSVISGSCDLIAMDGAELPAIATKNLARIRRATTQMTSLVNDLLTLARVGNTTLEMTEIDLSALCDDIASHLRSSAPDGRAVVSIERGLVCRGDAVFVRTVLENVVGNAWKYSSRAERPNIEVGRTERNGKTMFFVRDNGVGFAMSDAERLFAPFERLHKATEFAGSGVGLAAVHRIIERHGGHISAESAPGQGATFFFSFA
jgi:PAS domain S-box-containing protein